MEPANIDSTRSYLDFEGLGQLRGKAAKDGKSALRETAQQFEAMFLQQMMKSMREASFKSDLLQSDSADTFESMYDREVAMALSKRNAIGLADMLVDAQTRQMSSVKSTAEALQARAAGTDADKSKAIPLQRAASGLPLQVPVLPLSALPRPGQPIPLSTNTLLDGNRR